MIRYGAVVLCGGRSSRMGLSKPALPFGPEQMLHRVVRLLSEATAHITVVAAPGQVMPDLPGGVRVVYDRQEGHGPLEGLRAGLAALPEHLEAAYASGCDAPLLVPAFVARMAELLGGHAVAVARSGEGYHPLAAVYRRSVLPQIESLLAADRLRPMFLFDMVPTRVVAPAELTDVDPELASLKNINTPADYLDALARAGFTAPPGVLERFQG